MTKVAINFSVDIKLEASANNSKELNTMKRNFGRFMSTIEQNINEEIDYVVKGGGYDEKSCLQCLERYSGNVTITKQPEFICIDNTQDKKASCLDNDKYAEYVVDEVLELLQEHGYCQVDNVLRGAKGNSYVLPLYMLVNRSEIDDVDLYCFDSDKELIEFYIENFETEKMTREKLIDFTNKETASAINHLRKMHNLESAEAIEVIASFINAFGDNYDLQDLIDENIRYYGRFDSELDFIKNYHESYFECLKDNEYPFNDMDLVIDWDYITENYNLNHSYYEHDGHYFS